MTSYVLATANPHKADEIRAILAEVSITLLPRPVEVPDVDEDGETLEENALKKARALVDATGCPAIADDTGLFVDALDGLPGVRSARYAGEDATDEDNVNKLLAALREVPASQRAAYFRTVAAVAYPDGSWFVVDGVLPGSIADAPRGTNGFGYDVVFVPEDTKGLTLGEVSAEVKNALSHRGNAFRELAEAFAAR
jgi:XTP/dITP diphosphohydrolase